MRNYFKILGLDISASKEDMQKALGMGRNAARDLNPRHQADARDVLLDEERRQIYASTAQLYETLRCSASCLDEPIAKDTHRWQERLAEFDAMDA